MRRTSRFASITALVFTVVGLIAPFAHSLEKQPSSVYHARRVALAAKLHDGVAVLFAAEEPLLYSRNLVFGNNGAIFFPPTVYPQIKKVFDTVHESDMHAITLKQAAAGTQ